MLLGDAARLLREVVKQATIRRAYRYALNDRKREWYYDPFELEWAERNEARIANELAQELKDAASYDFKPAYAYFPPKTALCHRRMIYVPLKDLVVRYAFAAVVAELADTDLSDQCFANRRNREPNSATLLQDFATVSWPAFCDWQRRNSEGGAYESLLRTDISAFYDSVSHEYLIRELATLLDIAPDSRLMRFFGRMLQVRVLSYSHLTRQQREHETMFQGLCIGNGTEGLFANIYLNAIDRDMASIKEIEFGRYNDDMRIFAKDRPTARRAMLALQERLLTKGLNLNSSKTRFAEGEARIEELRSKAYQADDYTSEDEDIAAVQPQVTDKPFDEFDRDFKVGEALGNDGQDAKDFCHFLASRLSRSERQPGHIDMLRQILTEWHGSAKHATWRLVESLASDECPRRTREMAEQVLVKCLGDPHVPTYTKYRLLHHLTRPRTAHGKHSIHRYCFGLKSSTGRKVQAVLPSFIAETAFELNIIALYAMRVFGDTMARIDAAVRDHASKPVPLPIRNALSFAQEPGHAKLFPPLVVVPDEDAEMEDYH